MAAPSQTTPAPTAEQTSKPIHSLVLDTGPLIKNDPPVSTLIAKAEKLYILPSVLPEIRDVNTRIRVETQLLPFVTVRSPRPDSIKFVSGFARRTGDLEVLSRPDIEVLALGYELECERNGGDWRLRNTPGQKTLNGKPPKKDGESAQEGTASEAVDAEATTNEEAPAVETTGDVSSGPQNEEQTLEEGVQTLSIETEEKKAEDTPSEPQQTPVEVPSPAVEEKEEETPEIVEEVQEEDEDDDDDGWITPSNLKKHQAADNTTTTPTQPVQKTLQAAVLTSDFAMQNVALRMNLNLVAPSLTRITHLKSWVLRCHGCFAIARDLSRQFCPSCGQPTLLRTSCSTDERGNFRVHLKRNFQWNNRGNVYSVPRPVHGTASGKRAEGGGKGGWGRGLILAEDQKEFTRASDEQRRQRKKDLMDQDYLPGLLSGDRGAGNGRIRVGAGRNVNSKRKH